MACGAENMDKHLECAICLERYNTPRAIPNCLHSFCERCIVQHVTEKLKKAPKDDMFECPVCRASYQGPQSIDDLAAWVSDLPLNHVIASLMADRSDKGTASCEPCEYRGVKKAAVKHCTSCKENQCADCEVVHRSSKGTRSHILVDIDTVSEDQKFSSMISKFQHCSIHSEKPLEFYCSEHESVICASCAIIKHKKCDDIVELMSIYDSLEKENRFQKLSECLAQISDHIENIQETTQQSNASMNSQFDELKNSVQQARSEINKRFDLFEKHVQEITAVAESRCSSSNATVLESLFRIATDIKMSKDLLEAVSKTGTKLQKVACFGAIGTHAECCRKVVEHEQNKILTVSAYILDMTKLVSMVDQELCANKVSLKQGKLVMKNLSIDNRHRQFAIVLRKDDNVEAAPNSDNQPTDDECLTDKQSHPEQPVGNTLKNIELEAIVGYTEQTYDVIEQQNNSSRACSLGDEAQKSANVKPSESRLLERRTDSQLAAEKLQSTPEPSLKLDVDYQKPVKPETETPSGSKQSQKMKNGQTELRTRTSSRTRIKETTKSKKIPTPTHITQTAILLHNISVDPPGSELKPVLSGVEFLPDGKILLADRRNYRLILLDKKYKFVAEKETHKCPKRLCLIDNEHIAINFGHTKSISVMKTSWPFGSTNSVKTQLYPKAMVSLDSQRMLVSMTTDEQGKGTWSIVDMAMDREDCKTIRKPAESGDAYNLAVDKTHTTGTDYRIIQASKTSRKLYCYQNDGVPIFEYYIDSPSGIDVDRFGNLYVCNHFKHEIHQLSNDGQLVRKIESGSMCKPTQIAFSVPRDTFLVLQFESIKLQVFTIEDC